MYLGGKDLHFQKVVNKRWLNCWFMQMFDRLGKTNYVVELQPGVHLDSGEMVGKYLEN